MHEERRINHAGAIAAIIVVILLLPGLYFLSLGPLAAALGLGNSEPSAWSVTVFEIYAYPGQMLYDAGYGDWLSDYVEWWC